MKKIFAFVAAALIASSAMALDGVNVMASGLKSTLNDDGTMAIEYVLNTAATSIEIEFFDEAGDLVSLVAPNDASLLTAGAHQTTITIPEEDLEPGTYTWGIHAYAGATVFENKLPVDDPRYSFYLPQDVVVDNSFESPYFGRIYVSMPWEGDSTGGTYTTQHQKRGIFYYEPTLETVNGVDSALVGYDGGLGGDIHSRAGIKRLAIDEAGYVYVSSRDAATKGVYRMDPALPENPFVQVLAGSYEVDALEMVGDKMYTIEDLGGETGGLINTYDMTTVPVGQPTKSWSIGELNLNLLNADESIRSDRNGGFWIVQNRWTADVYPALTHLTKKGVRDFLIDGSHNADLLSNADGGLTYRGTLGVSLDGSMIAISSNKRAVVFSVTFGDSITLTKLCETPAIGGNIDGIAFDAADNLYVASASVEQFHMYPISKGEGENNSRVLAASIYALTIEDDTQQLPTAPETAPAAPTQPEADVMAIYCNHYATNNANFGISGWAGAYDILDIDGTIIAAWKSMSWECIIDPAHTDDPHDFSAYEQIHVDMWAPAAAKIKFTAEAVAGGNYKDGQVLDLSEGWNSFDIAVADWAGGYDFTNLKCFVLENYQTPEGASFEGNAFAIANVYFWKKVSAVDNVNVDTQAVKLIRNGQVLILRNGTEYNLLGSEMK